MIETILEFLQAVFLMLFVAAFLFLVVSFFTGSERKTQLEQHESQYRAACEAVEGRAVWNGNHWECLR